MIPAVAIAIVVATLGLLFTGKINRTTAAMAGAVVMLGVGMGMGFYTEELALQAIEFDALALLLGMMILVSVLEPTGFFQFVAIKAGQFSRGDPWKLMLLLSIGVAGVSLFFNNITTVVLVGPITILITEQLGLSAVPFLMAQALLSDTADVGTSVGDPASVIVASASGYSFVDFLTHVMPIVLVSAVISLVMLRLLFAKELAVRPENPGALMKLDADSVVTDKPAMQKVLVVFAIVVLLFIFQQQVHLSPGYIAIAGAAAALAWVRPDVRAVLERIDLPVLLFLIGLFVTVGGLEAANVFDPITQAMATIGQNNPMLLGVVIIWVVAALSALVVNVPVTIAMIALLQGLRTAGVDVSALWWAVVLGAGFGGNATSIGSGANIVIVSLSEQTSTPITPGLWSRRGLPVALATTMMGSVLFVLFYQFLIR